MSEKDHDIDQVFAEGTRIDRAAARAIREAVRRHKLLGHSVAVWRDGSLIWIPPNEIAIEPEDEAESGDRYP